MGRFGLIFKGITLMCVVLLVVGCGQRMPLPTPENDVRDTFQY